MKSFSKFFSFFGNTSGKKIEVPPTEKLARYELIRSIAQDAVDAAEKWADIQFKISGRKPMSVDKYSRAAAHLLLSSTAIGVEIRNEHIGLLIEAALGNNLFREAPNDIVKFGFETDSEEEQD